MKNGTLSALQFLIVYYGAAILVFMGVYVLVWGFTWPDVLPGMWTAVLCGAIANTFIQYFNAKAASIDAGEVSLTAPLQAMTPGLISGLGIILGEYPSKIGIAGIITMSIGSYILLSDKNIRHWWEYFGPIKRIALLFQLKHLSPSERNKTIVVTLALGSACGGMVGLLFDGLYTRRAVTIQGLVLAATGLVCFLFLVYLGWYLIRPDAKKDPSGKQIQKFSACLNKTTMILLAVLGILWVAHVLAIAPTFNHTLIAYTGTLKRLSILVSVVLGYFIFKESDFKKRFLAAILIVIGALLIASDDMPARLSAHIVGLGL